MGDRSASDARRRQFWRIGRLVCGVAAVIWLVAAISGIASAQTPGNNPVLTARCGLKVALVLDESQSISAGSGGFDAVEPVRSAATAFTQALLDTGSPLGITAFNSTGRSGPPMRPRSDVPATGIGYSELTHANISMFTDWIGTGRGPAAVPGGYNPPTTASGGSTTGTGTTAPSGTTNWQDAFNQVEDLTRTPGGPPNLVVFVTDGQPNTVGTAGVPIPPGGAPTDGSGGPRFISNTPTGFDQALGPAVTVANRLKAEGVRIFGVGVGPDVSAAADVARLREVSGPTEGTNPVTADYTVDKSFDALKATLVGLVVKLCGSRLIIHKLVSTAHGGAWTPGPDWKFTAHLTTPGHVWLEPSEAGRHDNATLSTGSDGRLEFLWTLPEADTTAHLGVTKETLKHGFHFALARCETHTTDGRLIDQSNSVTLPIPGATLGREQYRTCYVYNAPDAVCGGGGEQLEIARPPTAPRLVVSKKMCGHATVGDRVPITITVKNAGNATAHGVHVYEVAPPGTKFVAVGEKGSLKPDGTIIWHLGDLAPEKSRTVHATLLVSRPGQILNTAVADAGNRDPAYDIAPGRVRPSPAPPPPAPPPFTG